MRILLIGNFAPPYEEESLHNFYLLKKIEEEGNTCSVINISRNSFEKKGIINARNYFDFAFKLIRYGWKKDVIHYLTKSYTRLSLLKFMTSVLISRIFLAKPVVTLHSEMFSIFGQSRSQTGGAQSMYATFLLVHKVICGDQHTYESALRYYKKIDKFDIIPLFLPVPEDTGDNDRLSFKKYNGKKIIVFSHVLHPSLLFDVLSRMLSNSSAPDTMIAVSLSGKSSDTLRHVIEDTGRRPVDNLIFIPPDDMHTLSVAYAQADIILRPTICDGEPLFEDFALIIRKPRHSKHYVYFPISLLLIKEGNVSDLCAHILHILLSEKDREVYDSEAIDFYKRIRDIYLS